MRCPLGHKKKVSAAMHSPAIKERLPKPAQRKTPRLSLSNGLCIHRIPSRAAVQPKGQLNLTTTPPDARTIDIFCHDCPADRLCFSLLDLGEIEVDTKDCHATAANFVEPIDLWRLPLLARSVRLASK
jgi:hypothetical protein